MLITLLVIFFYGYGGEAGTEKVGNRPKIVFHPVDVIKREGTFYASAVLAVLETILLLKALRRPGDPRESTE